MKRHKIISNLFFVGGIALITLIYTQNIFAAQNLNASSSKGPKMNIDVTSPLFGSFQATKLSWGFQGSDLEPGKLTFKTLQITKSVDSNSSQLIKFCSNGEIVPEIEINMRKAGHDKMEYVTFTLSNAKCLSYSIVGSVSEDSLPAEALSLIFEEFEVSYTNQKPDGSKDGQNFTCNPWNICEANP